MGETCICRSPCRLAACLMAAALLSPFAMRCGAQDALLDWREMRGPAPKCPIETSQRGGYMRDALQVSSYNSKAPARMRVGGLALEVHKKTSSPWPQILKERPRRLDSQTGWHDTPAFDAKDKLMGYEESDTLAYRIGSILEINLGGVMTPDRNPGGFAWEEGNGVAFEAVVPDADSKEPLLSVTASRLHPGLLVKAWAGRVCALHESPMLPRGCVVRTDDGARKVDLEEKLNLADMNPDLPWLLAWAGRETMFSSTKYPKLRFASRRGGSNATYYKADYPVLFVFSRPPFEATYLPGKENGLVFDFEDPLGADEDEDSDGSARFVMLPMFGHVYPDANETETWINNGLPEKVVELCDWWAERCAAYPIGVNETCEYDAAKDAARIAWEFSYEELRTGGTPWAPVPPMLALALRYGFPAEFHAGLGDALMATYLGDVAGMDNATRCEWSVAGLKRYYKANRKPGGGSAPERLTQMLAAQVDRVLAAGHLAPWAVIQRDNCGTFPRYNMDSLAWGAPGDGIYFPAEILALLDGTPQHERLREYIRAERRDFPPEQIAHLPVEQGARREPYPVVPEFHVELVNKQIQERNYHVTQGLIPVESVYALARYYELFPSERGELLEAWPRIEEIALKQMSWNDWAGMGWFLRPYMAPWRGQGGVMEANEWAAAAIGLAKITDMIGKPDAHALAMGLLAKALAFRHGLAHYHLYAYDSGMLEIPSDRGPDWLLKDSAGSWFPTMFTYEWTEPAHDGRQVYMFNEFGLNLLMSVGSRGLAPAFRGMAPELGRFLRDYARGACANFVRRVELNSPEWFMAYAELPIGRDSVGYMLPEESHQLFMAHSWILGSEPDKLAGLLDVPWVPIGDFFYLHKLAETIKAYQGWVWDDGGERR